MNKEIRYQAPELLLAALEWIHNKLALTLWNCHQVYTDPFEQVDKFTTDIFEVEGFSYDEEYYQPYNFKWRDLEISWYKYLGRSTFTNRETNPSEINELLEECFSSIIKYEAENNESSN